MMILSYSCILCKFKNTTPKGWSETCSYFIISFAKLTELIKVKVKEGPCHKWWGIEERKNREEIDEQNQSGANEFPGTYHEKAWTWEHRSHWENWGQEKQRKTTAELHEKPQPAVENQWSRDHRKNKKPGGVENHDRQCPNWIRHLERERERKA